MQFELNFTIQLCKGYDCGIISLDKWLEINEGRPMGKMTEWFKQLVEAVKYLHDMKTIHRDLKVRTRVLG